MFENPLNYHLNARIIVTSLTHNSSHEIASRDWKKMLGKFLSGEISLFAHADVRLSRNSMFCFGWKNVAEEIHQWNSPRGSGGRSKVVMLSEVF